MRGDTDRVDDDLLDLRALEVADEDAEQKQKLAQFEADSDLQGVVCTKAGRRFVWRWLDRCGVWAGDFHPDSATRDFLSGRRNVALELIKDLQRACPELYRYMYEENLPNGR
jgi:hypothetical protein